MTKELAIIKSYLEFWEQLPVICRWKFFFEGEEDGWHFFIDAKDHEEAYEIAYDTHGPQVADMMYYNVATNGI